MPVSDSCFILNRFPIGNNSLLVQCYFKKLGRKNLIAPEYFSGKKYKFGIFEPFNLANLSIKERDNRLIIKDYTSYKYFSLSISKDFKKYIFLSKISKTILNFIREGDEEIFNLLIFSLKVNSNYNFNLIRFWLNLATILGFSLQNLNKPGWINLLFLTECQKEEIKNPYCIFISPSEFAILRKILNKNTKPFKVRDNILRNLERLFNKFFILQRENF